MSYQNGIINYLQRNEIEITFTDNEETGVTPIAAITSDNIVTESMSLKQSICDEEALTFGGCIASELSIKLLNTAQRQFTTELAGRWISVSITQYYADPENVLTPSSTVYPASSLYPSTQMSSRLFYVFSGYIDSATIDKTDKNVINIKAYDFLAKLHEEDATNFLVDFFKNPPQSTTPWSLAHLIDEICSKSNNNVLNITYGSRLNTILKQNYVYDTGGNQQRVGTFSTHNSLEWTSNDSKVSFGKLLKDVFELIGVFAYVNPNDGKGTLRVTHLAGDVETYDFYEKCETEEYQSTGYTDFYFPVYGNSRKGKTANLGGLTDLYEHAVPKAYDFSGNVLAMQPYTPEGTGRTTTPVEFLINRSSIGTRLALNAASDYTLTYKPRLSEYQPLTATLDGRLWVPIGSPIEILVNETTPDGDYPRDPITGEYILDENGQHPKISVKTYILSRTLTGIQALTDNITVKGVR